MAILSITRGRALCGVCTAAALTLAATPVVSREPAGSDTGKAHWAYQPVVRPPIPAVLKVAWVRNPIDAFVLAGLESHGWQPAPSPSPGVLLRRLYLDLIGLPPTPAEQQAALADPDPDRFDRLVEVLLGRPGYGERWGRHWLDLVRYADTNGYERDATKPFVWRYRDYVVRSLNDDKPFDRFVLEQLAGDELVDATSDTRIATGFARLGPWDDEPADPATDRYDQLDDIVSTTAQVFLGLTLGCARCHDHKFDALTAMDYYRMVAVFDPLERPRNGRTELALPAGSREEIQREARRDRRIKEARARASELQDAAKRTHLESGRSKLPVELFAVFRVPAGQRTAPQKALVAKHAHSLEAELDEAIPPHVKAKIAEHRARIDRLRTATPDLPRGYFLHEPSPNPPPTHLLIRGSAARPGPPVTPGVPAVVGSMRPDFPHSDGHTTRRRLALARWLTRPNHPLTARVIVNRVWQFHFGLGLVRTPSDFGVMGERPTHPELLDWLADWFVHEADWSLKKLHRLILTSNTWRMSKQWNPVYGAADPQNHRLWRAPYRRLEVEAIRDSMLVVSGQLNREMFGPSMYPFVPVSALQGHSDPDKIWKPFDERQASRRTVYAFIKRSMIVPLLEVLDLCDTTRTSPQRAVTTVAPQALTLFNGNFVNRQARHFADRLIAEVGADPQAQVKRAYRLALCRPPSPTEEAAMIAFLAQEASPAAREKERASQERPPDTATYNALVQMCRVIFNLNEFMYPD